MSLLYECINTVLAVLLSISSGQPNHASSIQICLQKLRILIEDSDQNLKYLGLLAMSKILETSAASSVQAHKDLIMQCLDDKDESIRLRSLDLLYGMVSKKNLMEIIRKLMAHMSKADGSHYRDELLAKIVDICSQKNYQHVSNFEWYVSVLVELTRMEGTRHGRLLAAQMLDVAIRVESIRPSIVMQMSVLIDNMHVFSPLLLLGAGHKSASDICEVLYAATWICGEFAQHLHDPMRTMQAMLKSKVTNLPGHIQSAFIQNVLKLYSHIVTRIYRTHRRQGSNEDAEENEDEGGEFVLSGEGLAECSRLTTFVSEGIAQFEQSADIEVQERACAMLQILKYVQKMVDKSSSRGEGAAEAAWSVRVDLELAALFEGELNPVAAKAQRKVPLPDTLDLDEWINSEPSDIDDNDDAAASDAAAMQRSDSQAFNLQHSHGSYTSYSSSNNNNNNNSNFGHLSGGGGGGYGGEQQQHQHRPSVSVGAKPAPVEMSESELAAARETRRMQVESNPFYIKSNTTVKVHL